MTEIILADGISYTKRGLESMKLLDVGSGHHVEFRGDEKQKFIFLDLDSGDLRLFSATSHTPEKFLLGLTSGFDRRRGSSAAQFGQSHHAGSKPSMRFIISPSSRAASALHIIANFAGKKGANTFE